MNNNIVYTSEPMDVLIENYVEYKFTYHNWIVSDNYVFNEKMPRHSHYSIIVTSPFVDDEPGLYKYESFGRVLVDRITSLIPFCGLPSLISKGTHDYLANRSVIVSSKSPDGWKTNYNEIRKELMKSKELGLIIGNITAEVKEYSIINDTPLKELEVMINKYNSISEEVKYLIFLNNSILSSTDSIIFMLMGKALEIINAMYPLKTKKDRRIEEHFPELTSVFNSYTIKDLMNLSNNRKETRHYIKDKAKLISHESLNEEERIMMYKCTICLITNVLREQFELPRPSFEFA